MFPTCPSHLWIKSVCFKIGRTFSFQIFAFQFQILSISKKKCVPAARSSPISKSIASTLTTNSVSDMEFPIWIWISISANTQKTMRNISVNAELRSRAKLRSVRIFTSKNPSGRSSPMHKVLSSNGTKSKSAMVTTLITPPKKQSISLKSFGSQRDRWESAMPSTSKFEIWTLYFLSEWPNFITHSDKNIIYVVANYYPAGNVYETFGDNVKPVRKTKRDCPSKVKVIWSCSKLITISTRKMKLKK